MKRKIVAGLAGLLLAGSVQAGGWGDIRPAYDFDREAAIVRVEGGAQKGKTSFYGFIDGAGTPDEPLDLESVYGEARVMFAPWTNSAWALAAEYNGGTGVEDTIRGGVTYTPRTGLHNFTQLKLFPVDTGGKGAQASIYSQQQLTERLSGSVLADYNVQPRSLYGELTLDAKLSEKVSAFVQARCFADDGTVDVAPVMGLKYAW